jgi:hypothetical protein
MRHETVSCTVSCHMVIWDHQQWRKRAPVPMGNVTAQPQTFSLPTEMISKPWIAHPATAEEGCTWLPWWRLPGPIIWAGHVLGWADGAQLGGVEKQWFQSKFPCLCLAARKLLKSRATFQKLDWKCLRNVYVVPICFLGCLTMTDMNLSYYCWHSFHITALWFSIISLFIRHHLIGVRTVPPLSHEFLICRPEHSASTQGNSACLALLHTS